MKAVSGTLGSLVPLVSGSQRFRTKQGLESLADQPERQGSLGDVSPTYTHRHAAGGQLQGAVEQGGLAQPGLPQDEQGPAAGPCNALSRSARIANWASSRSARATPCGLVLPAGVGMAV